MSICACMSLVVMEALMWLFIMKGGFYDNISHLCCTVLQHSGKNYLATGHRHAVVMVKEALKCMNPM